MEKTYLTKKGVNFPFNAEINVDHNGKLYYKESGCERHYFSKDKCKAPIVEIGKTTQLLAGDKAFVKQTGDEENVILNLGLVSGNIGPVGPIGEIGDQGDNGPPTIIPFSSSSMEIASNKIANTAFEVACIGIGNSFSFILSEDDKISNSSINDRFFLEGGLGNTSFIIPRNGYINNITFSFIFTANTAAGKCTLIVRFYISEQSDYLFTPLNGTSTDVILSNQISNTTKGFLSSSNENINVKVSKGDLLIPIIFATNNNNVHVDSVLTGICFGAVSII